MGLHQKPLITIGMSFLNEEATLELAIRSILAQSYTNWELLLWDDGSSDGSLKIARSFDDPRIRVYADGERWALSARMNQCIKLAAGKYFARMDADDISYPERLARQLDFLKTHCEVDLVASYISKIDADGKMFGKEVAPTKHQDIVKWPLLRIPMPHVTWLGRLSWFRQHLYCEQATYVQDKELLYRTYRNSHFAVIPEILVAVREDSLTTRKLMRTRIHFMRHVGRNFHGLTGALTKLSLLGILSLKGIMDISAVVTGQGYRLLRHRALPVTDAEILKYEQAISQIQLY
jgi:glycosyltransferase involved in cell wall biosynthesis